MVIFWGASSTGNTYSFICLNASNKGEVLAKKKISYGAFDADVVNN